MGGGGGSCGGCGKKIGWGVIRGHWEICKFEEEVVKMDISEVSISLENISLPKDQKNGILHLIDSKINNDMREVIAEIKQLETKIQMTHEKLSNEIKVVYWVIGIAMAVILFAVARK
jgi:hypothetical protein